MATKRMSSSLGRLVAACLAVAGLMASEYHGTVKAGGLAFPGATVTASQGDQKIVTTTDQQGVFHFSELADGTWTIEVEVLGFEKIARQVGVASDAPPADFELKFLTEEALVAGQGVRKAAIPETEAVATEGAITSEEIADLTPSSANSFIVQGSMSSALGMAQQNDWGMGPPGMGMGGPAAQV